MRIIVLRRQNFFFAAVNQALYRLIFVFAQEHFFCEAAACYGEVALRGEAVFAGACLFGAVALLFGRGETARYLGREGIARDAVQTVYLESYVVFAR